MTRKIWPIVLILLVLAGGIVWSLNFKPGGEAPDQISPESTTTFRGTHQAFFEGFDVITYEFTYPTDKFEVVSNEPTTHVVFKDKQYGSVYEVKITYEGGRGFTPQDYWNEVLKRECSDCSAPASYVKIPEASQTLITSNNSYNWLIFSPKNGGWLFIAKMPASGDFFIDVLKTFHVVETKNQQPASEFNVYFANEKTGDVCTQVSSVLRLVPKTPAIATAAIQELLKGPTEFEKTEGYFTVIPDGSKLNSLRIEDGVAYADFNARTESGGGSCSMAARTKQIRQTLLQFSTIREVRLSIDGRTGDIFQP